MVYRFEPPEPNQNPFFRSGGGEVVEISERQIRLAKKWLPRSITEDALKIRGVEVDEAYKKECTLKKTSKSAWKKGESNLAAEYMLLEGADTLDKTGWFGEGVYAYPSYEADDWLRGSDVILMFTDPDDESRATPLSIDVKTNSVEVDKHLLTSASFQVRPDYVPAEIYWADTTDSDPEVTTFQDVPPGRIPAVQAKMYLSSEDVQLYRSNKTPEGKSKEMLEQLGIEMRKQLQVQLEALALIHLGVRFEGYTERSRSVWNRKRLRKELKDAAENPDASPVLQRIVKILPQIWEYQKEEADLAYLRSDAPKQLLAWEQGIRELFGEEQKKSRLRPSET